MSRRPKASAIPEVVTMEDIAADMGVPLDTIHTYRKRATRNRRAGTPRPGDLPEPDATLGRTPGWHRDTYVGWLVARPGRGARTDLAGS